MPNEKKKRSLAGIAGIVAAATLISKVFGLVREGIIAAAFGVGPVINAYAYSYVIPGFLLILLGGINGPFHSALVSVLAKKDKSEAAPLVETVTTIVTLFLFLVTTILIIFAPTFIDILAPGLDVQVREIAILQLKIMAPAAILAGLIGIGFGTLNASDLYLLPSISPLFSSVIIVLGVSILYISLGTEINAPGYLRLGAIILAGTTLAGAIFQWLAQLIVQWRTGLGTLKMRFNLRIPGVKDVLKVMAPATLSSGMLHINVYTDLFFASFIENAAAAMRYGNFIVLTPVGIISNMILVPMMPVFSRLTAPENWPDLKVRIRQGLLLSAITMLPLTAIFISLAEEIVRVIYQRGEFGQEASSIVAPVLMAYGLGMFFYLGRDVLVRVFYALGDGNTPFKISIINIFLNFVLDYFLGKYFGTPGLVFATIGVNFFSMATFLWILNGKLNGLPLGEWGLAILGLIGSSFAALLASLGVNWIWVQSFGDSNLLLVFLQLAISMTVALIIFGIFTMQLKLPEVDILVNRIRQKLKR